MLCVITIVTFMLLQSITVVSGQVITFENDYPDDFDNRRQQSQQIQQGVGNQQFLNTNNIGGRPRPRQVTPTAPSTTTTAQPAQLTQCRQNCPVTSEYNPVCGTDGKSYNNINVLRCAQTCGINVQLRRGGPCAPRG